MSYWGGCCAVTGVAEPRLLRASHIKPWAKCDTDAERLDVYNGLLLAAHLDAAFDAGLISFDDDGAIIFSSHFAQGDRDALGVHDRLALRRVGAAVICQILAGTERSCSVARLDGRYATTNRLLNSSICAASVRPGRFARAYILHERCVNIVGVSHFAYQIGIPCVSAETHFSGIQRGWTRADR